MNEPIAMETELAWNEFKASSAEGFQKSSVRAALDTIAAQLHEIKVNTDRTAQVVPKIMGDESAVDAANLEASMAPPPEMEPEGLDLMGNGEDMEEPMEEPVDDVPEDMPEEVPEDMPEDVPEDVPEEVPEEPLPMEDEVPMEEPMDMGVESEPPVDAMPEDGTPPWEEEYVAPIDNVQDGSALIDAYRQFMVELKDAALSAVEMGDLQNLPRLIEGQSLLAEVWGAEICPALDGIYKSEDFSKSFKDDTERDMEEMEVDTMEQKDEMISEQPLPEPATPSSVTPDDPRESVQSASPIEEATKLDAAAAAVKPTDLGEEPHGSPVFHEGKTEAPAEVEESFEATEDFSKSADAEPEPEPKRSPSFKSMYEEFQKARYGTAPNSVGPSAKRSVPEDSVPEPAPAKPKGLAAMVDVNGDYMPTPSEDEETVGLPGGPVGEHPELEDLSMDVEDPALRGTNRMASSAARAMYNGEQRQKMGMPAERRYDFSEADLNAQRAANTKADRADDPYYHMQRVAKGQGASNDEGADEATDLVEKEQDMPPMDDVMKGQGTANDEGAEPITESTDFDDDEGDHTESFTPEDPDMVSERVQKSGRQLKSFKEMFEIYKSAKGASPAGGANTRRDIPTSVPDMEPFEKSKTRFRIGPGIDPHEELKGEWEEYKRYKARMQS